MVLLRMPECGVAGGSHDSHFEAVGTQVSSEHCMNRQLLSLLYDSTSPGLRGSFHYPSKAVKMLDEPDQTCSQTLEGQRGEMGPGVDPQTESILPAIAPGNPRQDIHILFHDNQTRVRVDKDLGQCECQSQTTTREKPTHPAPYLSPKQKRDWRALAWPSALQLRRSSNHGREVGCLARQNTRQNTARAGPRYRALRSWPSSRFSTTS